MITLKINMVKTQNYFDSLMYKIKTEDVYEDFSKNKEMSDFSIFFTQNIMMV